MRFGLPGSSQLFGYSEESADGEKLVYADLQPPDRRLEQPDQCSESIARKVVWALSYTRKITRQSAPIPHPRHRAVQFQTKTLSVSAFSHTFVNPPDHQIRYHLSFFFFFVQSTLSHGESRPRQATRSNEPRQKRPQWTCRVLQQRTSVSLEILQNVSGAPHCSRTSQENPTKRLGLVFSAHELVCLFGQEVLGQQVDERSVDQQPGGTVSD